MTTPATQQALDALHQAEAALEGQPVAAPVVVSDPSPAPKLPFEKHAASKQTPAWLVAGAKQAGGWGQGRELTEAEFDQAVADVGNIRIS
jgi:hypothetical protein